MIKFAVFKFIYIRSVHIIVALRRFILQRQKISSVRQTSVTLGNSGEEELPLNRKKPSGFSSLV